MKSYFDDMLGEIRLEFTDEDEAGWSCELVTPDGVLNCSLRGSPDIPSDIQIRRLKETIPHLTSMHVAAAQFIRWQLRENTAEMRELVGEEEDFPAWLALSPEEWLSRFELEQLQFNVADQLALILATDLEGEHGLAVIFDGMHAFEVVAGCDV